MTVQIDIDDTIDRAPVFFKWLTTSLKRDGHKVIIASSRTASPEAMSLTADELESYGVVYHHLVLSPPLDKLDERRFPSGLNPGHKLYVYKLITAQDHGTQLLFDDCGITTELFRKHLPAVKVFRFLPR